jgi:hypothetical protein
MIIHSFTPQKQIEKSSMINKGIRKEILWMKFESQEVAGQSLDPHLKFCQFLEGMDFLNKSKFVCLDVSRGTEYILAGACPLRRCCGLSLDLLSASNIQINFYSRRKLMISNIESVFF